MFANEVEAAFARLLDLLGVAWEYEPRTFVLGEQIGFTPDFYLPAHELYIELTVASKLSRKNKRLELMREQYPEVRLEILRRRDLLFLHSPSVKVPDHDDTTSSV